MNKETRQKAVSMAREILKKYAARGMGFPIKPTVDTIQVFYQVTGYEAYRCYRIAARIGG